MIDVKNLEAKKPLLTRIEEEVLTDVWEEFQNLVVQQGEYSVSEALCYALETWSDCIKGECRIVGKNEPAFSYLFIDEQSRQTGKPVPAADPFRQEERE